MYLAENLSISQLIDSAQNCFYIYLFTIIEFKFNTSITTTHIKPILKRQSDTHLFYYYKLV